MKMQPGNGFTVLELLITLSIVSILVTMGVPSFKKFLEKQALRAAIHSIHSDLLLARSQAVYQDMSVVACPGTLSSGCTGSTDWSGGWIVFIDENADRTHQDSETLVRTGMAVSNMAIHSSRGRSSFRFYPDGSSPGSNGSITFCGPAGPPLARKLIVSNLGRIRREDVPDLSEDKCL
jgi:type IV fimbrial biogenesis protein FimT